MKPKETEFMKTYLNWCRDTHNATVWTEVVVAGLGTADAVICVDGFYSAIEGKVQLSYPLLAQAVRWRQLVSSSVVVIPYTPQEDEAFKLAKNHFEFCGVGIHMVGDHVSTVCLPRFAAVKLDGIEPFLRDSQLFNGRFAKAGSAGGKRASKKNEEHAAIEDYIRDNEGCLASQAAKEGGIKASKLLKLIEKGEVKARIETIFGKSSLYPLTNDA